MQDVHNEENHRNDIEFVSERNAFPRTRKIRIPATSSLFSEASRDPWGTEKTIKDEVEPLILYIFEPLFERDPNPTRTMNTTSVEKEVIDNLLRSAERETETHSEIVPTALLRVGVGSSEIKEVQQLLKNTEDEALSKNERLAREAPSYPSPQWQPYTSYSSAELRGLVFPSIDELERAIELCWRDPRLKGVPRFSPDGHTLIVPEEAVQYFRDSGIKLSTRRVFGSSDLSFEELAAMRQRYGM